MNKIILKILLYLVTSLALFGATVLVELSELDSYSIDLVKKDIISSLIIMLMVFIPYEDIFQKIKKWKK